MNEDAMRAAIVDAERRLVVGQAAKPACPAAGIRVRIEACGICGSDLHASRMRRWPAGLIPGHEIAGRIYEIGPDARAEALRRGLEPGTRVVVEPLESCRSCFACEAGRDSICPDLRIAGVHRPGGFAEWISLPASRIHRVSDEPPLAVAALCEPLAVAVHGIDRGGLRTGERVLVLGGGPVGLLSGFAARASGASEVVVRARHSGQRTQAATLGLEALDAKVPIRESRLQSDFDLVIETVGGSSDTLAEAAFAARPGGRVVVLGLFDRSPSIAAGLSLVKELSYHWSNCYAHRSGQPADFERAARWIEQHHTTLACLATHSYPLTEIDQAFARAHDKQEGVGRVSVLI